MTPTPVAFGLVTLVALGAVDAPTTTPSQARPTFRADAASVSVNVSVRDGNTPVVGLSADDFRLLDNGIPQSVSAISIEAVPVDVTVFHDTSPSQGRRLDELKRDVRRIAGLLRNEDRFRLLTFGAGRRVRDVFGWAPTGTPLDLDAIAVAPISPVNDALVAALMHRPDTGRRHLVVALTDAVDAGSVVSSPSVRDAAARAEGVLHLVMMGGSHSWPDNAPIPFTPGGRDDSMARLRDAAALTGGRAHDRFFGSPDPVDAFDRVFEDFRTSYVLHYVPAGVEPGGWHDISVEVPGAPGATVRARRGYYGR
jgi:VWFA-related protein